jgi:hypothetical protein
VHQLRLLEVLVGRETSGQILRFGSGRAIFCYGCRVWFPLNPFGPLVFMMLAVPAKPAESGCSSNSTTYLVYEGQSYDWQHSSQILSPTQILQTTSGYPTPRIRIAWTTGLHLWPGPVFKILSVPISTGSVQFVNAEGTDGKRHVAEGRCRVFRNAMAGIGGCGAAVLAAGFPGLGSVFRRRLRSG